jgi:hypothetical protein
MGATRGLMSYNWAFTGMGLLGCFCHVRRH